MQEIKDIKGAENRIDLAKYVDIISRRRYLFFSIIILVTAMSLTYSYTVKKVYKASSTILVEKDKIINPLMRGLAVSMTAAERLTTIKQLIISRSRLLQVIKKLDLDLHIESPLELERLIENMRRSIQIDIIGKNLYRISFEGDKPQVVKNVTNTICNIFIEENLGATRGDAHDAFSFIEAQLEIYKKKLEDSENELRIFKEKNLGQLPGQEGDNLKKLEKYRGLLTDAENEFKEAQLQKSLLEKQLAHEKPLIVFFSSSDGDSINTAGPLEAQLAQLNAQLNSLLVKYTESYPEVLKLKAQIEDIKRKLSNKTNHKSKDININNAKREAVTEALNPQYQQLREDLGDVNISINILESRIKEYKEKVELYENQVLSIPRQEQELARLQRGYDVNVQIYKTLLSKLEEARISRELEIKEQGANFQIIDAAQLPLMPSKPNRPLLILLGLAFGIAAALAVTHLLNYLDSSIANVNEARSYFNLPILASIPVVASDEDIKKKRMRNMLFFSSVGVYAVLILSLLIRESMLRYITK